MGASLSLADLGFQLLALFRVADRSEKDETVIYSEETLRGLYQVCENITGEESKLDIELLFNAILTNKNRIVKQF